MIDHLTALLFTLGSFMALVGIPYGICEWLAEAFEGEDVVVMESGYVTFEMENDDER